MRRFDLLVVASLAMASCGGSEASNEQPDLASDITNPIPTADTPSSDDALATASSSTSPSSTTSTSSAPEVTGTMEAVETTILDESTDALTRLLIEVGVEIDRAPAGSHALEGALLCNPSDDLDSVFDTTTDDEECFRDAIDSSQPAVLVVTFYADEGDPIVRVQRATATFGTIRVFEDSSRDSYAGGGAGWRSYDCSTADLKRTVKIGRQEETILTC